MHTRAITFLVAVVTLLSTAVGCRKQGSSANVLRIGASPVPHAQLLQRVKGPLEAQGVKLEIVEMTDYVQPNLALEDGALDGNFFQHEPYLEQFNEDRKSHLVSVARVHVEPLTVYSQRVSSLDGLKQGATIALPNDPTNGARALLLLARGGLLTLREGVPRPTVRDVASNPKGLTLHELESAQLPRALEDVDAAVIPTNYALEGGLDPSRGALLREGKESRYANVLVVKEDRAGDPRIALLARALQSDDVRAFIKEHFHGALEPAF